MIAGYVLPRPDRRRIRYSLGVLLGIVTIAACCTAWLAREWSVVRERQLLQRKIVAEGGAIGDTTIDLGYTPEPVSWLRRLLGDDEVPWIGLHPGSTDADMQRVEAIFPEADVGVFEMPVDSVAPYIHP